MQIENSPVPAPRVSQAFPFAVYSDCNLRERKPERPQQGERTRCLVLENKRFGKLDLDFLALRDGTVVVGFVHTPTAMGLGQAGALKLWLTQS